MTIFTGGPIERDHKVLGDFPATTNQVMRAFESDTLRFSPTTSIHRYFEQRSAQGDETSPVLTRDEQRERIEKLQLPLKPVEGMRSATLDLLIERKQEEMADQNVISRASGWQKVGGFGVGFLAGILDPLNLAVGMVPVVGPTRYAGLLARQTTTGGRAFVRAGTGAAEGFLGSVALEPFVAGQAANEQADYTMTDTIFNLTFGTVLGGGLHAGFGFAGDKFRARELRIAKGREEAAYEALTPQQREELFRANLGLAVDDRGPVGPDIFDLINDPRLSDAGILDQGNPADIKIEYTEQNIIENGVTIAPEVEAAARAANPELFAEVDRLRSVKAELPRRIEGGVDGRSPDPAVERINEEIAVLRAKQAGETKRNAKKTQAKITALELKRQEVLDAIKTTDTPQQAQDRRLLAEDDEALRDRAVEVSTALRDAGEQLGIAPEPRTKTVTRVSGLSFEEQVTQARSINNQRLVNIPELERRTAEIAAYDDVKDMAAVSADTADIMEEVNLFSQQIDDPEIKQVIQDIIDVETENVHLAEGYEKALRAAFGCMVR